MTSAAIPAFRMDAPLAAQRIRWPDAFGTRFLVSVDVEEEFDWTAPLSSGNRAVAAMRAFPQAHRIFADRGIGLACMVDHPVATDPAAIAVLAKVIEDGRSNIGAQLHSWVTPPHAAPAAGDSYAGNLPRALEAAKLDTITDALRQAFGVSPIAYRAGRYGVGPNTASLLSERGYRIDSSVRARYDYSSDAGPDFTAVGNAAYRLDAGLIELPLTAVFAGRARRWGPSLYPLSAKLPLLRGGFARTGMLQRVALTPEDMPIADALEAVSIAVGEERLRLLTLSFHSPSLEPGHTPYVRDAADLAGFWQWWDRMFDHLDRLGVRPASVADVIAAADAAA